MRVSEIERLKKLRQKQSTGNELTDKEKDRLKQLEELEEKENDGRGKISDGRGNNTRTSEARVGSSQGTEQGERDKRAIDTSGPSDKARNSNIDNSSASRQTGGINGSGRSADNTNGSDRGLDDCEEYGGNRGNQNGATDGSERGIEEEKVGAATSVNGLTPDNAVVPRTRKKKSPAEKSVSPVVSKELDFIGMILQSGFGMIANVTARPHWNISSEEAASVSTPLTKMFDVLDKAQKKKFEKYINPVMLATSVAGIVIPRLMMDMAIQKEAKRYVGTGSNDANSGRISSDDGGRNEETGNKELGSIVSPSNATDVNAILAGFSK